MTEVDAKIWQKAASFAARFHAGQMRKDGKTPYIAHPFRVAMTVRDVFGVDDPTALAAALLHDVIEDTAADYDDIAHEFDTEIADVVAALTKDTRMPKPARDGAYDRQLAAAPWQARLVKLADVYDNIIDSVDASMKTAATAKAIRAIANAGDEPQIQSAANAVKSFIESDHLS